MKLEGNVCRLGRNVLKYDENIWRLNKNILSLEKGVSKFIETFLGARNVTGFEGNVMKLITNI